MKTPLFQLHKITKRYGERIVLRVDHLSIPRGEILAIVGPSGAGKSTLLRLLNFLEPPTEGTIDFERTSYHGKTQPSLSERRRITTVFQRPALLNRSVKENVAYGLQIRGSFKRGTDDEEPVRQVLNQVGLAALANQPARTLSGGEMQRVALARALVIQPDVLLLDEPTANLDPQNVALIEAIVQQVNAAHQTTVVLVTHNIFQARRLAHRVAFVLDGQIIEVSPTETIFTAPQDPRTAAFVRGDMIY